MLYIDNKQMGVEEAKKLLGSPFSIEDKMDFELTPNHMRVDKYTGKLRHLQQISIPYKYTVKTKTGSHTIAFSDVDPIAENGTLRFIGPKPGWKGATVSVEDPEKAFFFYHYPRNEDSPFKGTKGVDFKIRDLDKMAQAELEKEDLLLTAQLKVRDEKDPVALRRMMKGFKQHGVDQMTVPQVKNWLMQRAKANPKKFLDDVESQTHSISGIIQESIDRRIIVLHPKGAGGEWRLGDRVLHTARDYNDAFNSLLTACFDDIDGTYRILTEASGMQAKGWVDDLIEKEIIKLDDDGWYFYKKKGTQKDEFITEPCDVSALKKFISDNDELYKSAQKRYRMSNVGSK